MSDTPTPETDSVTRSSDETPWTPLVCAGHAKRIERERDETMESLALVRKQLVAMKELNEARRERDEARRELDLVSDKLCKSESAYLKNEEIIDGLKNEIEHTETFFREKLSRAADELNEAKRERDEARRLASVWEKLALREASINGEKICAKEES